MNTTNTTAAVTVKPAPSASAPSVGTPVVPYTVHVVQATQQIVDHYLARNHGNRRISPDRVAAIARDIQRGNWRNNGSTVVVDADGNLKDGQHRLHAIRAAGCPPGISLILVKLATRGAEADRDFRTMNTGRTGSASQMFATGGTRNPREVVAICRMMVAKTFAAVGGGSIRHRPVVTNAEIADCYAAFSDTVDFWAARHSNSVLNFPSVALAAFAMLEIAYPERVKNIRAIATDIGNGENLAKGSPTHRLFSFIMDRRSLHMSADLQDEIFETVLTAMNRATANNCENERTAIRSLACKPSETDGLVRAVSVAVIGEKAKRAA